MNHECWLTRLDQRQLVRNLFDSHRRKFSFEFNGPKILNMFKDFLGRINLENKLLQRW